MVQKFFQNSRLLLSLQQTTILSAASIIAVMVVASRILGLIRDRLLASHFGASSDLALYIAAARLPEMIFEILILGALSVAFIPVFTGLISQEKKEEAWKMTSSIINISLLIFLIITVLILIFVKPLSFIIAPGLVQNNPQAQNLLSDLIKIMVFAQLFFIVSGFLTAILQSYQRFLIPALAAVWYNLGIIFGIIALAPTMGIYGPAWGMVLGAFLHVLIQIPLARSLGFRHFWKINLFQEGVSKIGKLMLPRIFGVAASQINETINIILASLLSAKSLVAFNFAQHLQLAPLGLFGAAIAQAALPALSKEAAQKDTNQFKKTLLTCLHQILFLVLPAAAILVVLRIPMVRLIFGASRFDWEATVLTGRTLAVFAASLFAQSTILLLARAFYALQDTKTPVKISLVSVFVNIFLSFLFLQYFSLPIWGLALSFSLASLLNAVLLLFFLDRKIGGFNSEDLFWPAFKIALAALIMAVCLYIPMKLLDKLVFDTTKTVNLLMLTGIASFLGLGVYLFLTYLFKVKEVNIFFQFISKIKLLKKPALPSGEIIDATTPH